MKILLSIFIITIMSSYALNNQVESISTSLVSSGFESLWKRKDSILPAGGSIYSRNEKYVLTMDVPTCQLILKKIEGKILWRSVKTKLRNCYAILRGNSNFEIVSGKITVWSINTSNKQKGKSPYKLRISNKGNIIIKNNKRKCSWALFGCPAPKKLLKKLKNASPKKQYQIAKKLMKMAAKKRKGLPIKQLPLAKGAPKIKNQLPKALRRKAPAKKVVQKLSISKSKAKKMKNLIRNGGKKAVKKLVKNLKGKVPKKQLRSLRRMVKRGISWKRMRQMALRRLKKKLRKIVKKARRRKSKKLSKIKTKKQLIKVIAKLTWMQKIKRAIMRGTNPYRVKRMMRSMGNVRGNVRFWNKMIQMIRQKNWNQVKRLIALPARQKAYEFRKPKRWVTRRRVQRYYKRWRTWTWRRTYRGYWHRHCWRVWWWTRCRNVYRRSYYNYRYYYWTGAWRYRWVSYRRLE